MLTRPCAGPRWGKIRKTLFLPANLPDGNRCLPIPCWRCVAPPIRYPTGTDSDVTPQQSQPREQRQQLGGKYPSFAENTTLQGGPRHAKPTCRRNLREGPARIAAGPSHARSAVRAAIDAAVARIDFWNARLNARSRKSTLLGQLREPISPPSSRAPRISLARLLLPMRKSVCRLLVAGHRTNKVGNIGRPQPW